MRHYHLQHQSSIKFVHCLNLVKNFALPITAIIVKKNISKTGRNK